MTHSMATFTIPNSQGQTRQNNRSETMGELLESFNLDLNKKLGKINTSKKLLKVLDAVTHLGSSDVIAFEFYKNFYYVLTNEELYRCSGNANPTVAANWSEVTQVNSAVSGISDLVVFNDFLLISNGSNAIYSWNGSAFANNWSTGKLTTTDADFAQMHVWRGSGDWLFVASNNKIHYYNATAGEYIITLPADQVVTCFSSGVSRTWVGTTSTSGGNAFVYEVLPGSVTDVLSDTGAVVATVPRPENAFEIEGTAVMSLEVIDNVPHAITEQGNIQAFNGAGFKTIVSFPFANTTETIGTNSVHPKGMVSYNNSLYINISTQRRIGNFNDYVLGCPSGIWEYNKLTGQLTHRFAFVNLDVNNGALETARVTSGPISIIDNEYALLLAGAEVGAETGGTSGMFADIGSQYGWFKTIEIESDSVADIYEAVYAKVKTMATGESVVVKYRILKLDSVFASGTLATPTTFNTTEDLSAITPNSDGLYDWELTDIHTGRVAQVVSVVQSASTYSVTVDQAIGTADTLVRAEFQNWTQSATSYQPEDGEVKQLGGFGTNPWIQFKVYLNGAIEMRQFMVKSNNKHGV